MGEIRFYSRKDGYGFLSNFARYPITVEGKIYPTSEHFYQSQKFRGTDYEELVRLADSPRQAANLGRDRAHPLRDDWEEVKDDVMRVALTAKFYQHDELGKALLQTGDAVLIEHTERDSYWGDGGDGRGKNMLGRLLMETRSALQGVRTLGNLRKTYNYDPAKDNTTIRS